MSRITAGPDQGPGATDHGFVILRRWFVALIAVIVGRLAYFQLFKSKTYSEAAEAQRTNVITIHGKRGTIYDRNGNVLAISVECRDVYANPQMIEDPDGVAQILAAILGGEEKDYLESLAQDTTFVYIERHVDQEIADALEERLDDAGLTGIYYLSDTKRVYPYDNVGAQILGFVNVDGEGVSGLEYYYNDLLASKDGEMIIETGETGIPIAGGAYEIVEAKNGTDLMLTLDIDLQATCEELITLGVENYLADDGAVVVMDPNTGELLAGCSTPLPDFSNLEDAAALNLSFVSSSYEPGSIFKVITTSIGFELGLFTPDSAYDIPGSILVGSDTVRDDDLREYTMNMTVREILRRSSNVGVAYLVQNIIGAKDFAEGVEIFGIGTTTGIDFPGEVQGIVKSYDEYDGSTAGSMAFGQGVAIPIVQMVRVFAAIANDGFFVTPHFLRAQDNEELEWPKGSRIISATTANLETDIMRTVMLEGTGTNGYIEGYDIAGKTGTGEQAATTGAYQAYNNASSLMGFVNADDPEALVYVGLYGTPFLSSDSAAYVFQDVLEETIRALGINSVS